MAYILKIFHTYTTLFFDYIPMSLTTTIIVQNVINLAKWEILHHTVPNCVVGFRTLQRLQEFCLTNLQEFNTLRNNTYMFWSENSILW